MSNRSWTEWRLKMPTNDERRDVARKLREAYAKKMNAMGYNYDHQIAYARRIRKALGVEQ